MSKEQEKALEESIAHWERMRDGNRILSVLRGNKYLESTGDLDCACCTLAHKKDEVDYYEDEDGYERPTECAGCPIYQYTGLPDCRNTPYNKAAMVNPNGYGDIYSTINITNRFYEAAQAEINFLQTVLVWVQNEKPDVK